MINFIVAATFEHVIGKDNKLPWSIKEELLHFKKLTLNSTIVMGRKTFESLPGILPNRDHIILTRNLKYCEKFANNSNITIINDYKIIVDKYFQNKDNICWIIGGQEIFEIFLPYVSNLHISWIMQNYLGDIYLPCINWNKFKLINEISYDKFIYRHYKKEL